ncbi:FBD-associated F-box protein At1g61320-like [Tasmannia lanceolata]|uniref:FBD-associated F-box protein At1g61320-like n=1 Tax=Tasmannia lanceolata TaxID=3420 RepID=UPI0040631629
MSLSSKHSGNKMAQPINLPDDVIENIFSFLPMNTVRLIGKRSRRFKGSYISNRNLHFDKKFAKRCRGGDYTTLINHVLSFHTCPKVLTLKLFLDAEEEHSKLEEWIDFAASKEVEELDLKFRKGEQPFQFPLNIFNNPSVKFLELSSCELNPPPKFTRLHSLRDLFLYKVGLDEQALRVIFSDCKFLQSLEMKGCSMFSRLEVPTSHLKLDTLNIIDCDEIEELVIGSPNLNYFYYCGYFIKITLSNNNDKLKESLRKFVLQFDELIEGEGLMEELGHLQKLMSDLTHVEVLTLNSTVIQCLGPDTTGEMLNVAPFALHNLKEFQLLMEPEGISNPFQISFFLSNCPNLERVFIDILEFTDGFGFSWELFEQHQYKHFNYTIPHLKYVKLTSFKYNKNGMQLLKFLIENASSLETLVLVASRNNSRDIAVDDKLEEDYVEELRQAYPNTNIVVYGHGKDAGEIQPTNMTRNWA